MQASTLSQYQTKAGGKDSEVHEDFFAKQARLKAEAKLALAQVCGDPKNFLWPSLWRSFISDIVCIPTNPCYSQL
jgi:hypothetical protein